MKTLFQYFAVCFWVLQTIQAVAQQQVGVINQKLRKTEATQVFMIADSTQTNFSMLLHDRDSLYAYLLDRQYKTIKKASAKNTIYGSIKTLGELVVAQYEGNGVYSMLFYQSSEEEFIWITANYTKRTVSYTSTFRYHYNKLKQTYLGVVTYQNSHYAITLNYDKTNFYAHRLSRTDSTKIITFQPLEKAYYNVFQSKKVVEDRVKVDYTLPNNLFLASKKNKLYMVADKVYFTADRNSKYYGGLSTHYDFILDFATLKVEEKEIHLNILAQGINSFIYDKKLYLLGAIRKEELEINIIDLQNRQLLKKYSLSSKEPISFANSPMVDDYSEAGTDLEEYKNTKKFLNDVLNDVAIVVNRTNDNQIELKIGYCRESSGGGGYYGGGGTIGGYNGVGGMAMPTYYSFGGGNCKYSCAYFKTHLDLNTGEYIKRDNSTTVFSKYNAFKTNMENTKVYGSNGAMVKIKPTAILGYFIDNKLLYGYYDNVNEVYKLVEFTDGQ